MRTTLNIDDALIKRATQLSGISGRTSLIRAGLEALIAQHSSKKLAKLGGTGPKLKHVRRRIKPHKN